MGSGAGMGLLLIVVTPLIWSVPIALMSAELGTALPAQGGYYVWSKRAMGPFAAFSQGWWAWLTTWVDMALYPLLFLEYWNYLFCQARDDTGAITLFGRLLMLAFIWAFTGLNLRGAKAIGDSTKVLGFLLMLPFVLMVVIGLYRGATEGFAHNPVQPFGLPGQSVLTSLTAGIFVVMWNYLGGEGVATAAGEMRNPRRDYPKALGISIPLITLVYLLPSLIGLAVVGTEGVEWTAGAWSQVAEEVGGPWLGWLMSAMGMVSAIGLFSALLMVNSRVPFVMGRDGYLPRAFMRTNRRSAPWVSLVVSSAIYSLVILYPDFESLAVIDVTLYSGYFLMELASLVVLRIREPRLRRPFRVPGGWPGIVLLCAFPLLVIVIALSGSVQESGWFSAVGVALMAMATALVLYPLARWWKIKRGYPDDETLYEGLRSRHDRSGIRLPPPGQLGRADRHPGHPGPDAADPGRRRRVRRRRTRPGPRGPAGRLVRGRGAGPGGVRPPGPVPAPRDAAHRRSDRAA
jgi:amino acid transporter